MLVRFLSSLRLTLALLLGLALISIWGTLRPVDGRFDLYYQSLWFRLVLCVFALNLSVCTVKTILRNLNLKKNYLKALRSEQVFSTPLRYLLPSEIPSSTMEATLKNEGYHVEREGSELLARRSKVGIWGSTLVHLSFLLIMLGALLGGLGFVGTLNIYVGDSSPVCFDWDLQKDRPLGFVFRLDHFEPIYYPKEFKFTASDPETNEILETYTAREGETVELPLPGFSAEIRLFDLEPPLLLLDIRRNGELLGEYRVSPDDESFGDLPHPGVRLRPIAFRDPILKQLHSEVTILKDGREVKKGVIEVNRPLVYDGISIYQTAHNMDDEGRRYAGFQFTKDPGENLVWFGCILLISGLLLAFFLPYRAVGITKIEGKSLLIPLSGFRGSNGSAKIDFLGKALSRED